jgi:hypothetical protein
MSVTLCVMGHLSVHVTPQAVLCRTFCCEFVHLACMGYHVLYHTPAQILQECHLQVTSWWTR